MKSETGYHPFRSKLSWIIVMCSLFVASLSWAQGRHRYDRSRHHGPAPYDHAYEPVHSDRVTTSGGFGHFDRVVAVSPCTDNPEYFDESTESGSINVEDHWIFPADVDKRHSSSLALNNTHLFCAVITEALDSVTGSWDEYGRYEHGESISRRHTRSYQVCGTERGSSSYQEESSHLNEDNDFSASYSRRSTNGLPGSAERQVNSAIQSCEKQVAAARQSCYMNTGNGLSCYPLAVTTQPLTGPQVVQPPNADPYFNSRQLLDRDFQNYPGQ